MGIESAHIASLSAEVKQDKSGHNGHGAGTLFKGVLHAVKQCSSVHKGQVYSLVNAHTSDLWVESSSVKHILAEQLLLFFCDKLQFGVRVQLISLLECSCDYLRVLDHNH